MLEKTKLKEILLQYDIVVNNEWLDKYLDLIYTNLETKKQKYITNSHHVIPIYYYNWKYKLKDNTNKRLISSKLADNDQNNFKINLRYTDHMLAHYYLALAAKNKLDLWANVKSIKLTFKNINNKENLDLYQNLKEFLNNLEYYEDLYKKANEYKKELLEKRKGLKKAVHKEKITKLVKKEELQNYLDAGWELGHYVSEETLQKLKSKRSEEFCKKVSEGHKGKTSGMLGKHFSDESIEKLKKSHSKENNGMWGKKHSQNAKNKMSKKRDYVSDEIKNLVVKLYVEENKSIYAITKIVNLPPKRIQRILLDKNLITQEDYYNHYKTK